MDIKYTTQGLLIYLVMAFYVLAFVMTLLKQRKAGHWFFFLACVLSCCSFAYRWRHVGHVPLQNLFEVFLCLGAMVYPVSVFCRRVLGVEHYAIDMLLGAIVLFPAGFVFSAEPLQLPPALQSWLFAPHVAVYMLSYVFMAKAAFQALAQFGGPHPRPSGQQGDAEILTYRLVCAGFPLLTMGLLAGSCWGQQAWGDYWGWDPKELWSLASWLIYVGYFHFRSMQRRRYRLINSIWVIAGMASILTTLLWVNLSRLFQGLHSYAGS